MKKIFITFLTLLSAFIYVIPSDVSAAVTLLQQIDEAAEGSTIQVSGDYTEDIIIDKDIILTGTGDDSITGVWNISGGVNVEINDLNMTADTADYLFNVPDPAQQFPKIALATDSDDGLIIKANSIYMADENISLQVKKKKQLEVIFDPVDTTNQVVEWKIADDSIAEVSDAGLLTAKKAGETTLTITADGLSVTYQVEVTRPFLLIALILLFIIMLFMIFVTNIFFSA